MEQGPPYSLDNEGGSSQSRAILSVTSCPTGLSLSWSSGRESSFVGAFFYVCCHFWVAGFFDFKIPAAKRK